jgi:hypothetical protein
MTINLLKFSTREHSKMHKNLDFRYEVKPSGNPESDLNWIAFMSPFCNTLLPLCSETAKGMRGTWWWKLAFRWQIDFQKFSPLLTRVKSFKNNSAGFRQHVLEWKRCSHSRFCAGLPDFSWHNVPKWGKYTKWPQEIPKCLKIDQMAGKFTKWP